GGKAFQPGAPGGRDLWGEGLPAGDGGAEDGSGPEFPGEDCGGPNGAGKGQPGDEFAEQVSLAGGTGAGTDPVQGDPEGKRNAEKVTRIRLGRETEGGAARVYPNPTGSASGLHPIFRSA